MVGLTPCSKRAPIYKHVPPEQWSDWRWQLSNRLNSVAHIGQIFHLTESERKALTASSRLFRVEIAPYFISLIDPENPATHRQALDGKETAVQGCGLDHFYDHCKSAL